MLIGLTYFGDNLKESETGICYECQTKDDDASQKPVYHCDECGKWFCELHLQPKLPYFVDWETQFDVQGNPAIKAMFYSEYRRQDGHADFTYLRQTIERMAQEEAERNRLIQQGIDRMIEANMERNMQKAMLPTRETTGNKYGHKFIVPREVYENPEYREYLDHAENMKNVDVIVDEFNRKFGKKKKHWWQKLIQASDGKT